MSDPAPAQVASALKNKRIERVMGFLEGCPSHLEKVDIAAQAETEALGNLASALQANRENTLVSVTTALRSYTGPSGEESSRDEEQEEEELLKAPAATAATEKESSLPGVEETGVEGESALNQFVNEVLKENAALKERVANLESNYVPRTTVKALEEELASTKEAHKAAAKSLEELHNAWTNTSSQMTVKHVPSESHVDRGANAEAANYLRHPVWSDYVADLEARVMRQSCMEDVQGRLAALEPENESLKARVTELTEVLENARSDAQCLTYQNGVLLQQLASLMFKHHEPVPLPDPLSGSDLAAFGVYQLPETSELRGVPDVTPAGQRKEEVVNLQAYSLNDVTELFERNTELTKQLWKATNDAKENATGMAQQHGTGKKLGPLAKNSGGAAAQHQRPLPSATVGGKRSRAYLETEPEPFGSKVERPAAKHRLESETEDAYFVGPVEVVEACCQTDSLATLKEAFGEVPHCTIECKLTPQTYSSSVVGCDVYGAERLVATTLEAASVAAAADAEALEMEKERSKLFETALVESHMLVESLEEHILELEGKLRAESEVATTLRTQLATAESQDTRTSVALASIKQHLAEPLRALVLLESALNLASSKSEKTAATEALMSFSAVVAQMTAVVDSLEHQETALIDVLQAGGAVLQPPASKEGGGEEGNQGDLEVLRNEVNNLRTLLESTEKQLHEAKENANAERMKHMKILDHVWQADVQCQEMETRHQEDLTKMNSMVPVEKYNELESSLAKLQDVLEATKAGAKSDEEKLEEIIRSHLAAVTEERKTVDTLRGEADVLRAQGEKHKAEYDEACAAAISAQTEAANLTHDVQVLSDNVAHHQQLVQGKTAEMEGLTKEIERQRAIILSQQCTREHVKAMFPGDTAIELSLQRLVEVESEAARLQQELVLVTAQSNTYLARSMELQEEKNKLEHRIVLAESTAVVANDKAKARVAAAEEAASAAKFQNSMTGSELQRTKGDLEAALSREKLQQERIEALSNDPVSANVRKYGVQYTNDLLAQMDELHNNKTVVEQQLSEVQAKLSTVTAEKQRSTDRVAQLEADVKTAQAAHNKAMEDREQLSTKLGAANQTSANLQQTLAETQTNLSAERKRSEGLRSEISDLGSMLEAAEQRGAAVDTEKNNLFAHLTGTEETLATTEEHLAAARSEVEALDAKQQELKKTNDALIVDNMKLKEQTTKLTCAVTELQARTTAASSHGKNRGAAGRPSSVVSEIKRRTAT